MHRNHSSSSRARTHRQDGVEPAAAEPKGACIERHLSEQIRKLWLIKKKTTSAHFAVRHANASVELKYGAHTAEGGVVTVLQLNDGQVARVCAREMQANDDNCLQKGAYSIEYLRPAVVPQVPTNQTEPGQRASGKIRHVADKCDTCARARNKFQKFKKGSENGATNGATCGRPVVS